MIENIKEKVLFIDLVHTLIKPKKGKRFPSNYNDWEFIEKVKNNVIKLYNKGYKIIVVTNQGGISEGHTDEKELLLKFEDIKQSMSIDIIFFYASTINKKDYMRKPNIGMSKKASKLYDIDLEKSIMVGDASGLDGQFSDSDIKFAENSNIGNYYDIKEFEIMFK